MSTPPSFTSFAATYGPRMMSLIEEVVAANTPGGSSLVEMCRYHLQTGGKRLRAVLPLLIGAALDHEPEPLLPFGAACEMLHNATLVHDDLQDGDTVRRGHPTVWARFGAPQAVNLGDAMFYYTLLLVGRLDVPPELRERLAQRVLRDTLQVIAGQEHELALRALPSPTLDDYFAMVEGKTSGLFALPMAGAAELCAAPEAVVAGATTAARHLGVLFQIQDDVLDLYAEKGRERSGSDVAEGKRSVLAVHCLGAAPSDEAAWLRKVLDLPREATDDADIDAVRQLFRRTGSLRFALEELRRRRDLALAAPGLESAPALVALLERMSTQLLKPIQPVIDANPGAAP